MTSPWPQLIDILSRAIVLITSVAVARKNCFLEFVKNN